MLSDVKNYIEEEGLLYGVKNIIIAYSGGPDSTFLKELFMRIDVNSILAYFNHNIRDDSEKEEEFVRNEAKKSGLPLIAGSEKVKKYCSDNSLSLEVAARELRYEFLFSVKERENAELIATGHNLDDHIENFFIRLFRGSGFGLTSMKIRENDIVRPLLRLRKKDIKKFLDDKGIPYYTDYSNLNTDFLRNRIRQKLIPVIENIYPDAIKGINKSIKNLRGMEESIKSKISNAPVEEFGKSAEIERKYFDNLNEAEKAMLLKKMLSMFDNELDFKRTHLKSIKDSSLIELSNSFIEVTSDKIIVSPKMHIEEKELKENEELEFGDFIIEVSVSEDKNELKENGAEYFDYDSLRFPLTVRARKNGDRIDCFGSNDSKKVKDIFINEKIPRIRRDLWPIICEKKDILLIPSLRRSNKAKVTDETNKIIKIKSKRIKNAR